MFIKTPSSWSVRNVSRMACFIVLVTSLAFGAVAGYGQGGQGGLASISGTVTDATGAVMAGVTLKLTNTLTGQERPAVTTSNGTYVVPLLPVGNYTITASHAGFKTETRIGIILTADQTATVNMQLEVGQVTQSVEVSANAEMLNTTNGAIGQVVEEKTIVELPLNGRNPAELVFLAPGAIDGLKTQVFTRQDYTTMPTETGASVNGGRQGSTYYMLDGANNMDSYTMIADPFPNPDATQEFRVMTNNFDSQYGFAPGAVVSIVTRSGTNQLHGDIFEFIRNDKLNAADFFAKQDPRCSTNPTICKDTLKRNQFGGSLGGKIIRDKLFIFGNYQATIEHRRVNGGSAYVPSNQELNGDFSALGYPLTNPATGQPFPNNGTFIDPSTFNPVALKFEAALPKTDDPTGFVRIPGAVKFNHTNEFTIKTDYYPSPKHHISGRLYFNDFLQPKQGGGGNMLLSDRSWHGRNYNYSVNWAWTIQPNLLSNLVGSFGRLNTDSVSGLVGPDGKPVCYPCYGSNVADYPTTPPGLDVIATNGFWVGQNANIINRTNVSLAESVTWNKGRHMVVAGVDVLKQNWDLRTDWLAEPLMGFWGGATGDDVADFLLGKSSFFWQGGGEFPRINGNLWGFYGQDTIRLKPNLTLNAGLRWEPYVPPMPSKGRIPVFHPGQQSTRYPNAPLGLVYPGDAGVPAAGVQTTLGNWAPRLSLAWQPKALPNTSIRAAFGMFVAPIERSYYNHSADTAPFSPTFQYFPGTADNPGQIDLSNPWAGYLPSRGASPFPPFAAENFAPPSDVQFLLPVYVQTAFAPNFRLGQEQSWNVSIEHQLTTNALVRIAYVGSESYHMPTSVDRNPGVYSAGGNRVFYPNFTSILEYQPISTASYNGLQLSFEKRFSHGIQYTANYTFSKSIDSISTAALAFTGSMPDPFDVHFNRGISDLNFPDIWVNYWVYQQPNVTRYNKYVDAVLGGWQFSGIWRMQSGVPFSIFGGQGNNNSLSTENQDRADFVPGQPFLVHKWPMNYWLNNYFNQSAFTNNAPGTFGNTPRNIFAGPGTDNFDLLMAKNFPFRERYRVQFRWEMFNAFNRTQFGLPGSTLPCNAILHPGCQAGGASGFGQIHGTGGPPRVMQVAMKLYW